MIKRWELRLKLAWRHYRRHRWQLLLNLLGIGLGVAVVLGVDLTNASARRGFELANQSVGAGATHQIFGQDGWIDEQVYRELRVEHGYHRSTPLLLGDADLADDRHVRIVGIDPLSVAAVQRERSPGGESGSVDLPLDLLTRPGAALVSRATADWLGLTPPGQLDLTLGSRRAQVTIIDTIEPDIELVTQPRALVVDIASAQEILDRPGQISRIDLDLSAAGESRRTRLETLLPPTLTLETTGIRGNAMREMTRAFQINLTALSLLALLIGGFLIYNTLTLTVLQRRPLIATARTLGLTRGEIVTLIVFEALALALAGGVLGAWAGVWLSQFLVQLVARTLNDYYFATQVQSVSLHAASLLKAGFLGVAACLAAAVLPAREAAATAPVLAESRSRLERAHRGRLPWLAAAGLLTGLAAVAVLAASERSVVAGVARRLLLVIGFALTAPALLVLLVSASRPILAAVAGLSGALAARSVLASLSRTQVAVTALSITISATLGVGLMISSFRTSVESWIDSFLRADIYLSQTADAAGGIPPGVIEHITELPEVTAVSTTRWQRLWQGPVLTRVYVVGIQRSMFAHFELLGAEPEALWEEFATADAVLISEPFAWQRQLGRGGTLSLNTAGGARDFRIIGVFRDYGSDQGVVAMHENVWRRHWSDRDPSALGLYLQPGVDADALMRQLLNETLAGRPISARVNRALKAYSLEIFDRSFAITGVLRLLTVVIAFAGVLGALNAIQLERAREFALLRITGMTPSGLYKLILAEGGLMGLVAGALAIPLGLVLARVLIHVINRRSFGWSMEMVVDPPLLLSGMALGLVAGLMASLYPAWRMTRRPPAALPSHG